MPDWIIYAVVIFLAAIIVVNVISMYQAHGLIQFLKSVGKPVTKDYFDPFAAKAGSSIQYGDITVSGFTSVSKEGIYLESVFKFYIVVPWSKVCAIRIIEVKKRTFANLRISHEGEINRRLIISWNREFDKLIPETVSVVRG